ncbi:MAG TPA: DUF6152 family protein [Gammaproteobacteria bacterium]|nr:DUF6152 family protein [Gammaproteobacteria bacterium]
MKGVFSVAVGVASLLAAASAGAHHSFAAEFDVNRPVKLTGTVTKIEWTNPHAWVFVDAKDDKGVAQNWAIELVGINDLLRLGWGRDKVKTGDVISIDGFGAKNGTNTVNAASVSLANGELVWASQKAPEAK